MLQSFDDYLTNNVNKITSPASAVNSTSSIASVVTATTNTTDSSKSTTDEQLNNNTTLNDYDLKRHEITFVIEQILTNLLACGVLEFANGFENAINKIFKVSFFLDF